MELAKVVPAPAWNIRKPKTFFLSACSCGKKAHNGLRWGLLDGAVGELRQHRAWEAEILMEATGSVQSLRWTIALVMSLARFIA